LQLDRPLNMCPSCCKHGWSPQLNFALSQTNKQRESAHAAHLQLCPPQTTTIVVCMLCCGCCMPSSSFDPLSRQLGKGGAREAGKARTTRMDTGAQGDGWGAPRHAMDASHALAPCSGARVLGCSELGPLARTDRPGIRRTSIHAFIVTAASRPTDASPSPLIWAAGQLGSMGAPRHELPTFCDRAKQGIAAVAKSSRCHASLTTMHPRWLLRYPY
jgi:hypothetical protein